MPGPWYFEDQAGFGWLRAGLGGFNNTCGLRPYRQSRGGLGRALQLPGAADRPLRRARPRGAASGRARGFGERWEGGRCILEAVGRVTQAQTYGENLVLTRTYRAEMGASWFTMEDVVENRGYLPIEHMLLYHINVGYPFVDEGAELIAPVAGPPKLLFGTADRRGPRELVALHRAAEELGAADLRAPHARPTPTAWSRSRSSIRGCSAAPALSVRYDHRVMPNYIEWRMMGEGQYAVGIEPCTNGFGREAVKAAGELHRRSSRAKRGPTAPASRSSARRRRRRSGAEGSPQRPRAVAKQPKVPNPPPRALCPEINGCEA